MRKTLKYVLYGVGILLLLVVAALAFFAATFDPNDYKQTVINLVQEKKQRTLHLDGDIKLAFWPKLGADLGRISISEHNSPQEFASVQGLKVSLALLPLLHKQLVVDKVYVNGARATIVRHKDGSTNFDDLLSDDEKESQQIQFDIDGVNVSDSALTVRDEMQGKTYGITKFNLETGRVALGKPFDIDTDFELSASSPKTQAAVTLRGNVLADPDNKHFAVKGLDTMVNGDLASLQDAEIKLQGDVDARLDTMEFLVDGVKLTASGKQEGAQLQVKLDAPRIEAQNNTVSSREVTLSLAQDKAGDTVKADVVVANLTGSQTSVKSSGVKGEFSLKQGEHRIQSRFNSPFQANLKDMVFDLPKLAGNLEVQDPALPKGSMQGDYAFKLHADAKQERANADFTLNIAQTNLKGDVAVASFSKPDIRFNLHADTLDLNKLLGSQPAAAAQPANKGGSRKQAPAGLPSDLSMLGNLLLQGKVSIGHLVYDKYRLSGLNLGVKADGNALNVKPFAVKLDDSQIEGSFGIERFNKPIYRFDIGIDKLDADKYITQSEAPPAKPGESTAPAGDAPVDLSVLRQLNADGELRIGWLKLANVKSTNVRIRLKADDGVAELAPFSANLYDGSMSGKLKVDARTVPSIAVQQDMKGIAIGPLLTDALNNDMLSGQGSLSIDVTAQGGTVMALKKSLGGKAAMRLANGSVKGIDIAGMLRDAKDRLNVLKGTTQVAGDKSKKTDFSEMSASFAIRNGVAHNDDLDIKAPLFRIGGSGDIDIANQTLNYLAKPTVVATLKGQGGADLTGLNGVTVPIKLTGTFAQPQYALDFAGLAAALAQNKLLEGVGGSKGEAVRGLIGGDKEQAIKSLLEGKKNTGRSTPEVAPEAAPQPENAPAEQQQAPPPATPKDKAKEKLNKLLGL